MNTDVMKTFCDLVEAGSFSKAAEANFISQSAVSQQLAKLERDFSTQLINRGAGLVEPTEAGKAFYQGAKEILRRYERLLGEVRSAADAVRGVLRVGTIYSVGFYLLDPYVRRFLQAHPEVHLHIEYTHWSRIYAAVVNGEMDFGVVAYPRKQRSIEIVPLAAEELVLVCPPDHPLTQKDRIRPADLKGQAFVAFEGNIPTGRYIEKLLHAEKVEPNVVMEFDNIELIKRAVEVNRGVSILPEGNVDRECRYGDLAMVRFANPDRWVRKLGIIRRRGRAPGPAEKTFLALLREEG